ncbi:OmpH family outer membrane protein [uncultured Nonlabens sp.]|uniref:OmpH family outer membrane protein n=1 Tax=uncultured Nonlabens sp. TaxID=859306 RepID=UPI0026018F1C|nr:OmpH family outer membrane protein [uncultured Nonlabens sp.]
MKKIIALAAILISAASCQESQKIAFVDSEKVYSEYQEKIDLEAVIIKKQEDFKKKTDSLGRAYQMEAAPMQAKFSKLSQQQQQNNPEIIAFSQKWQMIESQMKAQEQGMQEQLDEDLKELNTHVEEFIATHAKKNNYSFVLGKNNSAALVYGNDASNITETVITELNKAYNSKNDSEPTSDESSTKTD